MKYFLFDSDYSFNDIPKTSILKAFDFDTLKLERLKITQLNLFNNFKLYWTGFEKDITGLAMPLV
jgi:hypothetical protein